MSYNTTPQIVGEYDLFFLQFDGYLEGRGGSINSIFCLLDHPDERSTLLETMQNMLFLHKYKYKCVHIVMILQFAHFTLDKLICDLQLRGITFIEAEKPALGT